MTYYVFYGYLTNIQRTFAKFFWEFYGQIYIEKRVEFV